MPDLSLKNFHFKGMSEGGVQTSVTCQPLDIVFDIGRCPLPAVSVPTLLLTHGHLDHAAGIPYYISQRSLRNTAPPTIYLPPELVEDTKAVLDIYSRVEGFQYPYTIIPAEPGQRFELKGNYFFQANRTVHRVKSVGYTVFEEVKKLKPEYQNLGRDEIINLKKNKVEITEVTAVPVLTFTGDTQLDFLEQCEVARKSKVLFIECTYVDKARTVEKTRFWGHIHLDEIIAQPELFENEIIVLKHFSKRYRPDYIRQTLSEKLPESLQNRVIPFL